MTSETRPTMRDPGTHRLESQRGAVRRRVASGVPTLGRVRTTLALSPLLCVYVLATFFFPRRPSDERNYVELAHNLLDGHYAGLGWRPATPYGTSADPANPDLWFGPGLPSALAPLVAVDLPIEALRLTGAIFLFGAVLVFHELLRLRVGEGTALVGAYALGLYFPFYVLLPTIHSEPLTILLIVSMLYLLSRYLAGSGLAYGIAAAAAAASVAMTRVAYGWVLTGMLVAFGLWWLVSRRRDVLRVLGVYALALALCLPWLAFTYSVTERLFVWGNSRKPLSTGCRRPTGRISVTGGAAPRGRRQRPQTRAPQGILPRARATRSHRAESPTGAASDREHPRLSRQVR